MSREQRAGARTRLGPEPLASGRVAEIQRQRILGAMAEVAAERGAANVTVAHIVARAGISRRTFYELFEDREECLLATLGEAIEQAAAEVVPAFEAQAAWRERIRAGLAALLLFLDEEPGLGRLCVIEALGGGERALERRSQCLAKLVDAIDEGRSEAKAGKNPPPLTAEGVVGAVFSIVHSRLLARKPAEDGWRSNGSRSPNGPLIELLGALMAVIVLPYMGQAVASRELQRPVPRPARSAKRGTKDPLEGLDMRLTYRTVRVLMAIAGHPRASNRVIATASGVSDQGQISKLLARLDGLGLIHNTGRTLPKGGPNAWELTPRGQQVERSIRLQGGNGGGERG